MTSSRHTIAAQRIALLSGQGKSLRWIGRHLGLAPSSVFQKLRELERESFAASAECGTPATLPPGSEPAKDDFEGPPGYDPANIRRCSSCGALVYLWPCLACGLASGTISAADSDADFDVDSDSEPCND